MSHIQRPWNMTGGGSMQTQKKKKKDIFDWTGGTQKRLLRLVPIVTIRLAPAKPNSTSSAGECCYSWDWASTLSCALTSSLALRSPQHRKTYPVAFGYMKVYMLQGQQTWNLCPFRCESVLPDITPLLLNTWFSGIHLLLTSPMSHMQWEMPKYFRENCLINIDVCQECS